jgi:hypothetical protein
MKMPRLLTRRRLLAVTAGGLVGSACLTGYAVGVEPVLRLRVTRYQPRPPNWPKGFRLSIAVIADLHACDPWMTVDHIGRIVEATNALRPDLIVLLGDYVAGHDWLLSTVPDAQWAKALANLRAPLGVHAILGNHDWWDDREAQERRAGPIQAGRALEDAGIPVLENHCVRLAKNGEAFWLAGLGDQWAFLSWRDGVRRRGGVDDLSATLSQATDTAPLVLLIHEPDVFPQVPPRVALTLAGHTHGGQVRVFGYGPRIPSRYGSRYEYGHIVEDGRHLIVSGGLGCSGLPIRLGVLPEIVLVDLGV